MAEPNAPWWLPWAVPFFSVAGALWIICKKLFVQAVRAEMETMHAQNQLRLYEQNERLQKIEKVLERIAGRMQERWGDSRED